MVQLPATAAIEYVAAGLFSPGDFWPGDFCPGDFCPGAYARSPKFNAYTHRLGFLCPAS